MSTKTTQPFLLRQVRLFENNRGMIGFEADVYDTDTKKKVGTVDHDGNSMTYNIRLDKSVPKVKAKLLTDSRVDYLLEEMGL